MPSEPLPGQAGDLLKQVAEYALYIDSLHKQCLATQSSPSRIEEELRRLRNTALALLDEQLQLAPPWLSLQVKPAQNKVLRGPQARLPLTLANKPPAAVRLAVYQKQAYDILKEQQQAQRAQQHQETQPAPHPEPSLHQEANTSGDIQAHTVGLGAAEQLPSISALPTTTKTAPTPTEARLTAFLFGQPDWVQKDSEGRYGSSGSVDPSTSPHAASSSRRTVRAPSYRERANAVENATLEAEINAIQEDTWGEEHAELSSSTSTVGLVKVQDACMSVAQSRSDMDLQSQAGMDPSVHASPAQQPASVHSPHTSLLSENSGAPLSAKLADHRPPPIACPTSPGSRTPSPQPEQAQQVQRQELLVGAVEQLVVMRSALTSAAGSDMSDQGKAGRKPPLAAYGKPGPGGDAGPLAAGMGRDQAVGPLQRGMTMRQRSTSATQPPLALPAHATGQWVAASGAVLMAGHGPMPGPGGLGPQGPQGPNGQSQPPSLQANDSYWASSTASGNSISSTGPSRHPSGDPQTAGMGTVAPGAHLGHAGAATGPPGPRPGQAAPASGPPGAARALGWQPYPPVSLMQDLPEAQGPLARAMARTLSRSSGNAPPPMIGPLQQAMQHSNGPPPGPYHAPPPGPMQMTMAPMESAARHTLSPAPHMSGPGAPAPITHPGMVLGAAPWPQHSTTMPPPPHQDIVHGGAGPASGMSSIATSASSLSAAGVLNAAAAGMAAGPQGPHPMAKRPSGSKKKPVMPQFLKEALQAKSQGSARSSISSEADAVEGSALPSAGHSVASSCVSSLVAGSHDAVPAGMVMNITPSPMKALGSVEGGLVVSDDALSGASGGVGHGAPLARIEEEAARSSPPLRLQHGHTVAGVEIECPQRTGEQVATLAPQHAVSAGAAVSSVCSNSSSVQGPSNTAGNSLYLSPALQHADAGGQASATPAGSGVAGSNSSSTCCSTSTPCITGDVPAVSSAPPPGSGSYTNLDNEYASGVAVVSVNAEVKDKTSVVTCTDAAVAPAQHQVTMQDSFDFHHGRAHDNAGQAANADTQAMDEVRMSVADKTRWFQQQQLKEQQAQAPLQRRAQTAMHLYAAEADVASGAAVIVPAVRGLSTVYPSSSQTAVATQAFQPPGLGRAVSMQPRSAAHTNAAADAAMDQAGYAWQGVPGAQPNLIGCISQPQMPAKVGISPQRLPDGPASVQTALQTGWDQASSVPKRWQTTQQWQAQTQKAGSQQQQQPTLPQVQPCLPGPNHWTGPPDNSQSAPRNMSPSTGRPLSIPGVSLATIEASMPRDVFPAGQQQMQQASLQRSMSVMNPRSAANAIAAFGDQQRSGTAGSYQLGPVTQAYAQPELGEPQHMPMPQQQQLYVHQATTVSDGARFQAGMHQAVPGNPAWGQQQAMAAGSISYSQQLPMQQPAPPSHAPVQQQAARMLHRAQTLPVRRSPSPPSMQAAAWAPPGVNMETVRRRSASPPTLNMAMHTFQGGVSSETMVSAASPSMQAPMQAQSMASATSYMMSLPSIGSTMQAVSVAQLQSVVHVGMATDATDAQRVTPPSQIPRESFASSNRAQAPGPLAMTAPPHHRQPSPPPSYPQHQVEASLTGMFPNGSRAQTMPLPEQQQWAQAAPKGHQQWDRSGSAAGVIMTELPPSYQHAPIQVMQSAGVGSVPLPPGIPGLTNRNGSSTSDCNPSPEQRPALGITYLATGAWQPSPGPGLLQAAASPQQQQWQSAGGGVPAPQQQQQQRFSAPGAAVTAPTAATYNHLGVVSLDAGGMPPVRATPLPTHASALLKPQTQSCVQHVPDPTPIADAAARPIPVKALLPPAPGAASRSAPLPPPPGPPPPPPAFVMPKAVIVGKAKVGPDAGSTGVNSAASSVSVPSIGAYNNLVDSIKALGVSGAHRQHLRSLSKSKAKRGNKGEAHAQVGLLDAHTATGGGSSSGASTTRSSGSYGLLNSKETAMAQHRGSLQALQFMNRLRSAMRPRAVDETEEEQEGSDDGWT